MSPLFPLFLVRPSTNFAKTVK